MSLCATVSAGPCMLKMKEATPSVQCSSPTYLCRAKAVGRGVVLPQQLSLATVALRKFRVSSMKILGSPTRSLVIRGATAEDVEAEKEMIEMDAIERMEKTLEATKSTFNTVRTGRASPNLFRCTTEPMSYSRVSRKLVLQMVVPFLSRLLTSQV